MFKQISLLIKKDFKELKYRFKAPKNVSGKFGAILYILFIGLLLSLGAFLYIELAKAYVNVSVLEDGAMLIRKKELLTATLFLIFVFNIITGINSIYKKIVSNKDLKKYSILPISNKTLFVYSLLYIFLKQFVISLTMILPMGIILGVISNMGVGFYLGLIFVIILMPCISIGFSALLVIPCYYIKKFLEKKYILLIVNYAVILGVFFTLYGLLLNALNKLLVSGNLSHFFNERKYAIISRIVDFCFPANILTNILVWNNVFLNLIIILSITAISILCVMFVINKCLKNITYNNGDVIKPIKNKVYYKQKNTFNSFFSKEITSIIRNPNFAITLFGVALNLPVLVYLSTKILRAMVKNLVYIDISYQLSFFVLLMFALLINTFCASNISRDGKYIKNLNILPVKKTQILFPKMLLCTIVSSISVILSALCLIFANYVTVLQGLGIGFVTITMCLAENFFATKYDLLHPTFSKKGKEEGELTTSSLTITTIFGFLITIAFSGLILVYSIFNILKGKGLNSFVIYVLPTLISVILLGLSVLYFFYKLNNKKGGIYEK